MSIYDTKTSKIYPDLNHMTTQEPQTYHFKKLTEIEAYLLNEVEVRERVAEKMKRFNTITKHRGPRPNYINSDHWRIFYCCICRWC